MRRTLNCWCDWKTAGIRKCSSAHSSPRLFCSGVPVSSRRRPQEKPSSVCQRLLSKFLM